MWGNNKIVYGRHTIEEAKSHTSGQQVQITKRQGNVKLHHSGISFHTVTIGSIKKLR